MKVTAEIKDYSEQAQPSIRIHSNWNRGEFVELEIEGKRYRLLGEELISAVKKCMLNGLGR